MSDYRADSEVTRVNQAAADSPVVVSAPLMAVLSAGERVSRESQGAFDVTLRPALMLWGFKNHAPHIPTSQEIGEVQPLIGYRHLVLDPTTQSVHFARGGMAIDLEGLAKGFATELAAESLRRRDLSGVIDAGGTQYMVGNPLGKEAWSVGIGHPDRQGALIGALDLAGGAISTTSDVSNTLPSSRALGRVLDPRTLQPSAASLSATVVSDDGTLANALSRAVFVLGPVDGLALLDRFPSAWAWSPTASPTEPLVSAYLQGTRTPSIPCAIVSKSPDIHNTDAIAAPFRPPSAQNPPKFTNLESARAQPPYSCNFDEPAGPGWSILVSLYCVSLSAFIIASIVRGLVLPSSWESQRQRRSGKDCGMARSVRACPEGGVLAAGLFVLLPAAAHAQSSLTGVVKDTSGAVLPGVTVEAASPVLIEKTRSVVTDAGGGYRLVDLRPGIYTLTFSLEGFSTVKREGVELPSNFVMTVNSEMKVGALEETLTVTGASPTVDVQSTTKSQVLNREALDAIPTGRTIQGMGQLITGVSLNIPDVGGSRAMQQTYMSAHGLGASQTTVQVDGLMVNGLDGDGAVQNYFNSSMSQEMVYTTSGASADVSGGGVRLNMIPRDGGNTMNGSVFAGYQNKSFQTDNLTRRPEGARPEDARRHRQALEHRRRRSAARSRRTRSGSSCRRARSTWTRCRPMRSSAFPARRSPTRRRRRARERGVDPQSINSVQARHHLADQPEEQAVGLQRSALQEPRLGDDRRRRSRDGLRSCGTRRSTRPGRSRCRRP